MIQKIERDAAARFEANLPAYEARARDLYAVTPRKWDLAGEVSASHILFAVPPHSTEEAQRAVCIAQTSEMPGQIEPALWIAKV